jgi:hypothetical protein
VDNLDVVSACLSRDIRLADAGESVDVAGIMADLESFRVCDLKRIAAILQAVPGTSCFRASWTKEQYLTSVRNRLTARERSIARNEV